MPHTKAAPLQALGFGTTVNRKRRTANSNYEKRTANGELGTMTEVQTNCKPLTVYNKPVNRL
jgi:hypothetical protein